MEQNNNGLNDLNHSHKDTKKSTPNFKLESFTGEEPINNELLHKLEKSTLQDLINSSRIDLNEMLTPPPVAMQIINEGNPITFFTKGNFSIVTGPAKSRKTFLISMLMAASIKGSFQDLFVCPCDGTNLIFDTEQSRYKVQQIAKRICSLSETIKPEIFQAFSLRTLEPSQRIDLIEGVLEQTPNINFVAIDGIIDLEIDPILQADQAQKIVSKLMKWTEIYNIHIVCVLHYNKTVATLLGHLGSFSHRKGDAIISVTKSKEDENISLVEPVDCREKEFLPFAFSVDKTGMPYILEDYTFEKKVKLKKEPGQPKVKGITAHQLEDPNHIDILNHVFNTQKEQGYNELWRNIKNAIEVIVGESIGDNKAKDFVAYYQSNEKIIKVDVQRKKPVYTLPGQSVIDFKLPV